MIDERNLRLKLGLPVKVYRGKPPFGYLLDRSKKTYYPKMDELELLLEVKELSDKGVSYHDLVNYMKSKADVVISHEGLRKLLATRAPYQIIKDSIEKREEAYKWMSQNLTPAKSI